MGLPFFCVDISWNQSFTQRIAAPLVWDDAWVTFPLVSKEATRSTPGDVAIPQKPVIPVL